MHENSRLLFERYALEYFSASLSVLEIGPDGSPSLYRHLVGDNAGTWHTLELAGGQGITYQAVGEYEYPIEDDEYDLVLSGQVLEHVPRIWLWMREVSRVCKPGGIVVTINPVSWPYHKLPRDCWRAYPDGMTALYEDSALEVLLSKWESLETPGYKRYIPGRSRADQRRLSKSSQASWDRSASRSSAPTTRSRSAASVRSARSAAPRSTPLRYPERRRSCAPTAP